MTTLWYLEKTQYPISLELEVIKCPPQVQRTILDTIKLTTVTGDGSITGTDPCEIRLNLNHGKYKRLYKLCALLAAHNVDINKTCGLHVHFDLKALEKNTSNAIPTNVSSIDFFNKAWMKNQSWIIKLVSPQFFNEIQAGIKRGNSSALGCLQIDNNGNTRLVRSVVANLHALDAVLKDSMAYPDALVEAPQISTDPDFNPQKIVLHLYHARFATNDVSGIRGCHPVTAHGWYLIHNGVVHGTDCEHDTQGLVNMLKSDCNLSNPWPTVSGYGAIIAYHKLHGLHVWRDQAAALYITPGFILSTHKINSTSLPIKNNAHCMSQDFGLTWTGEKWTGFHSVIYTTYKNPSNQNSFSYTQAQTTTYEQQREKYGYKEKKNKIKNKKQKQLILPDKDIDV